MKWRGQEMNMTMVYDYMTRVSEDQYGLNTDALQMLKPWHPR